MEKRCYWLGLSMIKGLGPIRINKLLQHFKDPHTIWKASARELGQVIGMKNFARKIVKQRENIDIQKMQKRLSMDKIEYITLEDEQYPENLKNIYDPPPVLFYKGKFFLDGIAVAIVGSRRSTAYGRKTAEKLGYELSMRNITVISGLARGIDTHGHIGALRGGGRTAAIMGSGLDIIYPPENRQIFEQIQEKGLVVSEFPPGVQPIPGNFPQRNRVISGLAQGVVVVEASSRSGSLITANLALEQGRELFALPGNIDRPQSYGTNNLIKNGAKLVTNVDDILEELFLFAEENDIEKGNGLKNVYPELSPQEEEMIGFLQQERELHINQLIERSGRSAAEVNTILLKLELKGVISRGEGKKYYFQGLQNLLKPL